jgi:hypothetical protein
MYYDEVKARTAQVTVMVQYTDYYRVLNVVDERTSRAGGEPMLYKYILVNWLQDEWMTYDDSKLIVSSKRGRRSR